MLSSQEYFIRVLSDYVNGRKTEYAPENLEQVYAIAKAQQLQTILYYQCKSFSINKSTEEFAAAIHQYTNRKALSKKVKDALSAHKVQFAFVKGYEIEKLYIPNPMRLMGDTDIMIHSENRKVVHSIMLDLGFECTADSGDEWTYYKNGICFEVHDSMVHPHKGNEKLLNFYNNLWDYGQEQDGCFKLDWNFHFCYMIQHISGHVIMTGIGFRQFLDIVMVAKNVELDWKWIRSKLSNLGLAEFADICYALCEKWFDYKFPFETISLSKDFFQETTEKMFSDGVFGHDNSENKNIAKLVERQMYGGNKNVASSKLSIYLEKIIPAYKTMQQLPYCKFIVGRKYLLPVAWCWRLVYLIFHGAKISAVKEQIQNADTDLVNERVAYLRKWGL